MQEFPDKQPTRRLGDSTTERRLHSCNSDNTLNAEGACAAVNGFRYALQPICRQPRTAQPCPAQPQCKIRHSRAVQALTVPQLRSMGQPKPLQIPLKKYTHCSHCDHKMHSLWFPLKIPQKIYSRCIQDVLHGRCHSRHMTLPTYVRIQVCRFCRVCETAAGHAPASHTCFPESMAHGPPPCLLLLGQRALAGPQKFKHWHSG